MDADGRRWTQMKEDRLEAGELRGVDLLIR